MSNRKEGTMVELYIYTLKGKSGIVPDRSMFFIGLLKKAGVLFQFHPKFDSIKGQLVFYAIRSIDEEIMGNAMKLIKGEGIKNASIERTGKYLSKK